MSEHVTQWLSAYQDGELRGGKRHHVETHLAECEVCQAALDDLQGLSALLHEVPAPEFTSPERLSAQVNLRLPRVHAQSIEHKVWEAGWWLIPVSLLSVWMLVTAVGWIGDFVSAANRWGLFDTTAVGMIDMGPVQVETLPAWLVSESSAEWAGALSGLGLLQGDGLAWATRVESFARNTLPLFVWQVAIAVLYLGWLAIWWVRHTRQEEGQLLDVSGLPSKMN
jgi:predicted anti-sigma-YlaC factor YlaD